MKQKNTRRGFTFLELLVVVLIIGILSAIAVPQYQKAVKKSKYVKMLAFTKIVADAQKLYYMQHGSYATSFAQLDIKLSASTPPKGVSCSGWTTYDTMYVDGVCVTIPTGPAPGVRVILPARATVMEGYQYLMNKYGRAQPGLYCIGRDYIKHLCPGTAVQSDAWGDFFPVK